MLVFIILVVALLARTLNLGSFGIWYDEKISLISASGISEHQFPANGEAVKLFLPPFPSVKQATIDNTGGNSIAYHLLLKHWIKIFGNSDVAIRLLSVFFAMLALIAGFSLAKKITSSSRVALIALALMAIHPLLIEFAREAKSYSMALFFSIAA